MTFSIVAHDPDASAWGVAAASRHLAVGALVGAASPGVGAIASQAMANLAHRADGLRLLGAGASAADALRTLLAADPGRPDRQVGVVDAAGRAATFTGKRCFGWAGGVAGEGYAIQGNVLAGPGVIAEMEAAYESAAGRPLADRLLAALTAGDAAGGDRRGRQSAALFTVSSAGGFAPGTDVLADLRVDDHPTPVAELGRLLDLHELLVGKPDPDRLLELSGPVAAEVRELLAGLGHTGADVAAELTRWAVMANLDGRLVPGRIDPRVLDELRRAAAG